MPRMIASTRREETSAITTPDTPPSTVVSIVSAHTSLNTSPRDPPIAFIMPISRVRSNTAISTVLSTPTPPRITAIRMMAETNTLVLAMSAPMVPSNSVSGNTFMSTSLALSEATSSSVLSTCFALMRMMTSLPSSPEIFCKVLRGRNTKPSSWVLVRLRTPTTWSRTFFSGTTQKSPGFSPASWAEVEPIITLESESNQWPLMCHAGLSFM